MRLFLVGGMATGIGITLLAFSLLLPDPTYAFYAYIGTIICTAIVVFCAVVNTFTTWAGYVHPEDRLWSNILAYLLTLFVILSLGHFIPPDPWLLNILFTTGTMIVLAYLLVFSMIGLSTTLKIKDVLEGTAPKGREKETTARFILLSLVIGGIMAGVQVGLLALYWYLYQATGQLALAYRYSAIGIGLFATLLMAAMGILLRSKYEVLGPPE